MNQLYYKMTLKYMNILNGYDGFSKLNFQYLNWINIENVFKNKFLQKDLTISNDISSDKSCFIELNFT